MSSSPTQSIESSNDSTIDEFWERLTSVDVEGTQDVVGLTGAYLRLSAAQLDEFRNLIGAFRAVESREEEEQRAVSEKDWQELAPFQDWLRGMEPKFYEWKLSLDRRKLETPASPGNAIWRLRNEGQSEINLEFRALVGNDPRVELYIAAIELCEDRACALAGKYKPQELVAKHNIQSFLGRLEAGAIREELMEDLDRWLDIR